jgi:hypothetical protein
MIDLIWFFVLNATFSNISALSWWKKLEYQEGTTDHGQATGKLYHLRLRVECTLFLSSPGQKPCELLPSLGVRRRPSVVHRQLSHLNRLLWNRWTKLTKPGRDGPWVDPFKIVSDSPALHSRWLLLLKIEISSIVHCCFSINQNELKFSNAATWQWVV